MLISPNGLTAEEGLVLRKLLEVYEAKAPRNVLRQVYFEGKNAFKDLGIAIPPEILDKIAPVMGWVETGVRALTDRSVLEGFVSPDSDDDPFGVDELAADSKLMKFFPGATLSSAIHSCSFLRVDNMSGDLRIRPQLADMSAAIWDRERLEIGAFLAVLELRDGLPVDMAMYLHEHIVRVTIGIGGRVSVERYSNPLGRVSVAPLPHKPDLKRPFGHSRITRPAMFFTDSAMRVVVRSEVQGEGFAGPQYWLMGADAKAFAGNNRFKAVMGRVFGLTEDPDTQEVPDVKRFEGASPDAHVSHLRMYASLFAGDQRVPLSSLGIIQDNPSSAQAIYAAKEDLLVDATNANTAWGNGAVDALSMAVEWRDGSKPEGLRKLSAVFTPVGTVSPTDKAVAFGQLAPHIPGLAESEVGLEYAGFSREQILRLRADMRKASISTFMQSIQDRTSAPSSRAAGAIAAGAENASGGQ